MSGVNGPDIAAVYQLLTEVARQVGELAQQVTHDITGLRETVALYHHSVVGHGIQFSEVERRTLRLERHLGLPPLEPEGRTL